MAIVLHGGIKDLHSPIRSAGEMIPEAFDMQHNYPLPNMFVSMLQRLPLETDKFASSTGTMRGLDLA